jgi:hypothetical protein
MARRDALAQVSTIVSLGTEKGNLTEGQRAFQGPRIEWELR